MLGVDRSDQARTKQPNREGAAACPHLGLASDQFAHYGGASPEHRCYLWMARERIDRAHQQRYCLTGAHAHCPWKSVTRRPPPEERRGLGASLVGSLRGRFDDLERVSFRATWPRAVLALLVFVALALATAARETARALFPYLRHGAWTALRGARRAAQTGGPRLARALGISSRLAGLAATTLATVLRSRRSRSPRPTPTRPVLTVEDLAVPTVDPLALKPVRADAWVRGGSWTCGYCGDENAPRQALCPRCHRVADQLEEYLRREDKLELLDGLKAIEVGGEARAFRSFVSATVRHPGDLLAWQWRARTAPNVGEVIKALEQLVLLDPADTQVQADLAVARSRYHGERMIAAPRPAAPKPTPEPSFGHRVLGIARRLSLEVASIPAFALGLLVVGQPARDLLGMLGLDALTGLLPAYALPSLVVRLPLSQQSDFLPDVSTDLVGLGMIALAVWYLYLAFRLTDGSPGSRWQSVGGGIVALASLRFAVAGSEPLLICALLVTLLAAAGREAPAEARNKFARRLADYHAGAGG